MAEWAEKSVFYHIYPLGFCGAPSKNDYTSQPISRIDKIRDWVEHIKTLGVNAVYLGPVFESVSHGYDTVDYNLIDRRLGTNETFSTLLKLLHSNDIRVVVDGVFNHVGRDFWAFKDVLKNGRNSKYLNWFSNLDFDKKSQFNDPFSYDTWRGYYNLVKLDLSNSEVKEHLFNAVKMWIKEYDIDGLRLDCADCLDFSFMSELSSMCKKIKPDFWIMGEVIHGDYNRWVNANMLDSVTNYVCYKGLYSSHNDKNYFEIAYSFDHQFGEEFGKYRGHYLYNFVDNHDVTRIASTLKHSAYLYPLHILLFTMPGIPSIYYGSEWGIDGVKDDTDENLRPELDLVKVSLLSHNKDLVNTISRLSQIRKDSKALIYGEYVKIKVMHEQFAYARITQDECIAIIVNSSEKQEYLEIEMPVEGNEVIDILNNNEKFQLENKKNLRIPLYPNWGRILKIIRYPFNKNS